MNPTEFARPQPTANGKTILAKLALLAGQGLAPPARLLLAFGIVAGACAGAPLGGPDPRAPQADGSAVIARDSSSGTVWRSAAAQSASSPPAPPSASPPAPDHVTKGECDKMIDHLVALLLNDPRTSPQGVGSGSTTAAGARELYVNTPGFHQAQRMCDAQATAAHYDCVLATKDIDAWQRCFATLPSAAP
jgi:hypothetical protein